MSLKECPKCGFYTTDRKKFKLEYKNRCWGRADNCTWADTDIPEHLHLICPQCGYEAGAQGCNDYKELKEAKDKAWSLSTISKGTRSTATTATGDGWDSSDDA